MINIKSDVLVKIDNYLELLKSHYDFELKVQSFKDRIIIDTPFNQKWELGIEILFCSIYGREEFYVNTPALNLYSSDNNLNKFVEEMQIVSKIVNDLNVLIDEWRESNE